MSIFEILTGRFKVIPADTHKADEAEAKAKCACQRAQEQVRVQQLLIDKIKANGNGKYLLEDTGTFPSAKEA